jgi:hypothetical protein
MQNKQFFLFWMAFLSLISAIVGVLTLFNVTNVEIIFWDKKPIESIAGKLAWVSISLVCLIVFSVIFRKQKQKDKRKSKI